MKVTPSDINALHDRITRLSKRVKALEGEDSPEREWRPSIDKAAAAKDLSAFQSKLDRARIRAEKRDRTIEDLQMKLVAQSKKVSRLAAENSRLRSALHSTASDAES